MKNVIKLSIFLTFAIFIFSDLIAQDDPENQKKNKSKTELKNKAKQHGVNFVDKDGDGYNDNAPDHDGDGIPNGLDPDYKKGKGKGFVDLDGDGINDNSRKARKKGKKGMFNSNDEFGKGRKGTQKGNVSGAGNNSTQGKQYQGKKSKRKGWN